MFDAKLRPIIDPPLNAIGRALARMGIGADSVTLMGMVIGIGAGISIWQQAYGLGLALIALNRLLDGLDGAVARATQKTDFGGYLDIVSDFVFYVAIPLGFGLARPENLTWAMLLIATFTLTGVSFLAFATLAAKRGLETQAHGQKSFFFNTGLAEGAETIAFFVVMCLWPDGFMPLAIAFSGLCILTVLQRTVVARRAFS
ncbi:MAG: CDP-alcohol phosphatidyltransferase family protein [Aquidulcibacter sp.]|jgi:phosphatidylglycerophosphate synthase|uniref:CDP-alcohol phosphatidyltransferase family protein n=1 Tax=Aquidulcibacter sp. TaxID=2052990 RepID=UPI0022C8DCD6|nr:CDP-alcohol phosphatidyltransferase family protein [Aquidulcibacter sp.]MCZ8209381.1 CDP-alcohol phosphatidyltransferase family protein [Aquidulcibacter sp.]